MNDLAARRFPPTEAAHAGAVFASISAVQADLSKVGVGKNGRNEQQRFAFRAWDDVQQALSPALATHKLLVVPRVMARECTERQTKSGSTQFHVVLTGEVQFVSGVDGSTFSYPCVGEAMDTGDKATSKALTMLMKYGLLHGLQIPLQGVTDPDQQTPEPTERITPTSGAWELMDTDQKAGLQKIAENVRALLMEKRDAEAYAHIEAQRLEADEKIALWTLLDSKERSALKKAKDSK